MKASALSLALICGALLIGCASNKEAPGSSTPSTPDTGESSLAEWHQETASNLVAVSDWSKPVGGGDFALCGRLLVFEESRPDESPYTSEKSTLIKVYVELQDPFAMVAQRMQIYFDLDHALNCSIQDADGKMLAPNHIGFGNWAGPYPEPCWITLPHDSSVLLRVNLQGSGRGKSGGRLYVNGVQGPFWTFPPNDTNVYFVEAAFTSSPPTNYIPATNKLEQGVWAGTLSFPRTKLQFKPLKLP